MSLSDSLTSRLPTLGPILFRGVRHSVAVASQLSELVRRSGLWIRSLICLGFLFLELRYITTLPLVMDEFAQARHISRLLGGIPYRDYTPYKTILGYFIQLPALLLSDDPWWSLIVVKIAIAVATTVCIFFLGIWLAKRYGEAPAVGALLLLVTHSTFLARSSELRVDMLSALFGTASIALLVDKRVRYSGFLAGLGVLCTQKAIYFPVAGCATLGIEFLLFPTKKRQVYCLQYLGAMSFAIVCYLIIALLIGDSQRVYDSVFVGPKAMALGENYPGIRDFWRQTLEFNPVAYGLPLAGVVVLLFGTGKRKADLTLLFVAVALTGLCVWHKQPWPYFFVLLIPTLTIVTAGVLARFPRAGFTSIIVAIVLLQGSFNSLGKRTQSALSRSWEVQKNTVEGAHAFLESQQTYFSGVELLWQHQHIEGIGWLDAVRIREHIQNPEVLLFRLQSHPPRLIINNYRVQNLHPSVKEWLNLHYTFIGGNLGLFFIEVLSSQSQVHTGEGGVFRLEAPQGAKVRIAGAQVSSGDVIQVVPGRIDVTTDSKIRLVAWSTKSRFLEQIQNPPAGLFYGIYSY